MHNCCYKLIMLHLKVSIADVNVEWLYWHEIFDFNIKHAWPCFFQYLTCFFTLYYTFMLCIYLLAFSLCLFYLITCVMCLIYCFLNSILILSQCIWVAMFYCSWMYKLTSIFRSQWASDPFFRGSYCYHSLGCECLKEDKKENHLNAPVCAVMKDDGQKVCF